MKTLRYACIGAGSIGRTKHLAGYAKVPGVEIAAVCDTSLPAAQAAAAPYGAKAFCDPEEMLQKIQPDFVSICTPNDTHAALAILAMRHGVAVHLEKPAALNRAQAAKILAVQQETGLPVMLGLNNRFTPFYRFVERLKAEDFFGRIYRVRCGWERAGGIPGIGRWFTDKARSGGGALIDLGIHYLDLGMDVLGWPGIRRVSGVTSAHFGSDSDRLFFLYRDSREGVFNVEDMASGLVELDGGASLEFTFSWASNIASPQAKTYIEILGEKGGISFEGFGPGNDKILLSAKIGGATCTITPDPMSLPAPASEFAHFAACVRNGTAPAASLAQGVEIMGLIDAIYTSAETHREVLF